MRQATSSTTPPTGPHAASHKSGKKPPGRWLYFLAAGLWLAVPLLMTGLAIPQVVTLIEAFKEQGMELQAPGRSEFHFQNPGNFALFVSGNEARIAAAPGRGGIVLERGLRLFLEDGSGRSVPLQAPGSSATVTMGSRSWCRVATFSIQKPGSYTLIAQFEEDAAGVHPDSVLVAPSDWPFAQILDGLMLLLPILAVALISIVLGVGLAMYVYVRRYDARQTRSCNL